MRNKNSILTILSPILLASLSGLKKSGSGNYTVSNIEELTEVVMNGTAHEVSYIHLSGTFSDEYLKSPIGSGFYPETIRNLFAMLERFRNVESIKLKLAVTNDEETLIFGATSFDKLKYFSIDFVTDFDEASRYKLDNSIFDKMPVLEKLSIANVGLTSLGGLPKSIQEIRLISCKVQFGSIPIEWIKYPNIEKIELTDTWLSDPIPLNFILSHIEFGSYHSSDGEYGEFTIQYLSEKEKRKLLNMLTKENVGIWDAFPDIPEANSEMLTELFWQIERGVDITDKWRSSISIPDLGNMFSTSIRRF